MQMNLFENIKILLKSSMPAALPVRRKICRSTDRR